jgi:hypothetical protein
MVQAVAKSTAQVLQQGKAKSCLAGGDRSIGRGG